RVDPLTSAPGLQGGSPDLGPRRGAPPEPKRMPAPDPSHLGETAGGESVGPSGRRAGRCPPPATSQVVGQDDRADDDDVDAHEQSGQPAPGGRDGDPRPLLPDEPGL